MPPRSSISLLPEECKAELNRRLISGGFSNYEGLSEWLRGQGFDISRSAVHRHGQQFEAQLEAIKIATEQAKAIAQTVGDDENALGDALTRLAQQKAFKALLELDEDKNEELSLADLGRMIATLNHSSVAVKRYRSQVQDKLAKTAEIIAKTVKKEGLSEDTAAQIRAQILGIAP